MLITSDLFSISVSCLNEMEKIKITNAVKKHYFFSLQTFRLSGQFFFKQL